MPEVGATLRESRMRARIDITEVETATKIRAKYLRALENEEWGLLPGPTYIKSFLRTYADYLGLDGRLLVEEYKTRYESVSAAELPPIAPGRGPSQRQRQPRGPLVPRWAVVGAVLAALVVALYLVGTLGSDNNGGKSTTARTTTRPSKTPAKGHKARRKKPRAAGGVVSLSLVPTGTVYVCLVDASGHVLIRGQTFSAGQTVPTFRSKRFRLTLGNNGVQLKIGGKTFPVAPSASAIGLEITAKGRRSLPSSQQPTCA